MERRDDGKRQLLLCRLELKAALSPSFSELSFEPCFPPARADDWPKIWFYCTLGQFEPISVQDLNLTDLIQSSALNIYVGIFPKKTSLICATYIILTQ